MAVEKKTYRVVHRFDVDVEECGEDNGGSMGKHYEASCRELTGCTVRAGTESEALRRMIHAIGIWTDLADRQLYDEVLYFEEQIDMRMREMGLTADELAEGNGKAATKKPIVQVTWLDAAHQEDDIEEKDIPGLQPSRMVSFGLLMADNDDRITISSHVATDVSASGDAQIDYRDTLVIPRQSVLAIEMLGELEVG
jgi:predicted RNase H-like HicB family nuclease